MFCGVKSMSFESDRCVDMVAGREFRLSLRTREIPVISAPNNFGVRLAANRYWVEKRAPSARSRRQGIDLRARKLLCVRPQPSQCQFL